MSMFAEAVRSGIDSEFIQWAETYWAGDKNRNKRDAVSTSQIRGIYSRVKEMEMRGAFDLPDLLILRPRLQYAASRPSTRQKRELFGEFVSEIEGGIKAVEEGRDKIEQEQRFKRFCQAFEAILAYHRVNEKQN